MHARHLDVLALRRPLTRDQVCQGTGRQDQYVAGRGAHTAVVQGDGIAAVRIDGGCLSPESLGPIGARRG